MSDKIEPGQTWRYKKTGDLYEVTSADNGMIQFLNPKTGFRYNFSSALFLEKFEREAE